MGSWVRNKWVLVKGSWDKQSGGILGESKVQKNRFVESKRIYILKMTLSRWLKCERRTVFITLSRQDIVFIPTFTLPSSKMSVIFLIRFFIFLLYINSLIHINKQFKYRFFSWLGRSSLEFLLILIISPLLAFSPFGLTPPNASYALLVAALHFLSWLI